MERWRMTLNLTDGDDAQPVTPSILETSTNRETRAVFHVQTSHAESLQAPP
jgi:hypothetical protein